NHGLCASVASCLRFAAERSLGLSALAVWQSEDALKALDFSNGLFSVHPSQYLTQRRGGQLGAASPRVAGGSVLLSKTQPFLTSSAGRRRRMTITVSVGEE